MISFSGLSIVNLLFLVVVVAVAIVSFILFFHWRKYGLGGATLAFMEILYLCGVAGLLAVAFFGFQ